MITLTGACWLLLASACGDPDAAADATVTPPIEQAHALAEQGDLAGAIVVLEQALREAGWNVNQRDALLRLQQRQIIALQEKYQWWAALQVTLAVLKVKPKDSALRLTRARLEAKTGRIDVALEQFERARELGEDSVRVGDEVAHALVGGRRFEQALATLEILNDVEDDRLPEDYGAYERVDRALLEAQALQGLQRYAEGREAFATLLQLVTQAAKQGPASIKVKGRFSWTWFRVRAYAGMIELSIAMQDWVGAGDSLEASPKLPLFLQLQGDLARAQGDTDQALRYYTSALEAAPTNWKFHRRTIELYLSNGDLDAAEAQITILRQARPNHPVTRLLENELLVRRGQCVQAMPYIEAMLRSKRWNPDVTALAAHCSFARGEYEHAREQSEKALETIRDDLMLLEISATSLVALRLRKQAWAVIREHARGRPAAYLMGAELAMRMGDTKAARELLSEAMQLDSADSRGIVKVLQALEQGESSQAASALEALSP